MAAPTEERPTPAAPGLRGRSALKVAILGGGPGGLYAAALLKRLDPDREITVWERNAPDDTFGFGVVLSDETLGGIEHADPVIYRALQDEFVRWDDIDIVHRGRTLTSGGHGFAALGRRRLLALLHERCRSLGVRLIFRTEAPPAAELAREPRPGDRRRRRAQHHPHRPCRRLPPAADHPPLPLHLAVRRLRLRRLPVRDRRDRPRNRPAARLPVREGTPAAPDHTGPASGTGPDAGSTTGSSGPLTAPVGGESAPTPGASTVIVEMREEVWRAAGLDRCDESASAAWCARLFSDALRGRPLRSNNSSWIAFSTVVNERWSHGAIVLLGDAAHTAHFSIGSGTKLAVEDALALAACLEEQGGLPEALAAYEAERRPVVASTQRAARASLAWFEELGDLRRSATPPVRLQPPHPKPPRHP